MSAAKGLRHLLESDAQWPKLTRKERAAVRAALHALETARPGPTAADVARATPAGAVPGFAGQWIPAARCRDLAPRLRFLLDGADVSPAGRALLAGLADDLEQGGTP